MSNATGSFTNSMSSGVRYGLVGTGEQMRDQLAPALQMVPGATISAVASRNGERARDFADRFRIPHWYGDWREMAGSGQLDALVVAGPPELHAEIADHCLERRIHVFVEKPPAPNSRVLADLVALEAEHPDVATFVGFNFPYGASYVEFRDALVEHTTPRVLKIRFVSSAPREPRWACKDVFETLLLGTAIHPINMAVRLFGAARSVISRVVGLSNGLLYLLIAVQFAHGNQAFLEVGNYSVRFEYRCELIGDGGVTGVLDQHNELSFTGIRAASADGHASLWDKCEMRYRWPSRRGGFERTGYQPELREFHRSIVRGARSDSTFADAVETYRIMDAVMEGA